MRLALARGDPDDRDAGRRLADDVVAERRDLRLRACRVGEPNQNRPRGGGLRDQHESGQEGERDPHTVYFGTGRALL